MPSPMNTGPARCACKLPPTTSGNSGKTQGFRVDNPPAASARSRWPKEAASMVYSAVSRAALIISGLVSPPMRAVSLLPLKITTTDWARTFKAFLRSRSSS